MTVFPWQRKEADGKEEFTLPDELQKQIKAGADAAAELPKVTKMLADLQSIMETSSKRQADADAAEAARKIAEAAKQRGQETDEQIEELMLTNPKEAIRLATQNDKQAIMLLRADNIRREVFEDQDKFKYYNGDIKREVDSLLAGQTLMNRNDPGCVENCYNTILGKHAEELREGKLKTRFASSESSSRGTNGSGTGVDHEKQPAVVTDEVRKAAKLFGIEPEKYATMLQEEGVGYV